MDLKQQAASAALDWRDIRVLSNSSIFEVLDAKRKASQAKKDFINDQDSTSGPGVIDNMIRNILAIKSKTFAADVTFGNTADTLLFEQLDWANLEFLRTALFSDLSLQLPDNVIVDEIEIQVPSEDGRGIHDTLDVKIAYTINAPSTANMNNPGPETIGKRIANISLSLAGYRGNTTRNGITEGQDA